MDSEVIRVIKQLTPQKVYTLKKGLERADGLIRGGVIRTTDTLRRMKLIEITSIYFQGRRTHKLTELGKAVLKKILPSTIK